MKFIKILIILIVLIMPIVEGKSGHMNLLTVSGENATEGGIADLYLEVRPGTGTIYIDSFPLTKLDTQISTRYANEIACDFLKKDCSRYDFFYTIRAQAAIVGGPSAGAAITILTISVLSNLKLDEHTIMSGTINSGGLIGPVAGINEKIGAAVDNGFTQILIPKWQSIVNISKIEEKELDNKITIVKVKNIEEALYYFTGKNFLKENGNVSVSKEYLDKMKDVSNILCDRSQNINVEINESNQSLYYNAQQFINRSNQAFKEQDYYARASYCFTANLRLRESEFSKKNNEELQVIYEELVKDFSRVEEQIDSMKLETLADLETFIIVKERLSETSDLIGNINYSNISSSILAYSYERFFSAIAWSEFFNLKSATLKLNEDLLQEGCLRKIAEAEERINYIEIYVPGFLEETKKEIKSALKHSNKREFALCIFKASKAKAEANILLTALTIQKDDLENVLLEKLEAIKKVIIDLQDEGMFPILGYSYYEYSKSLMDYDIISSLTFGEYALEFSRLDMYFPDNKSFYFNVNLNTYEIQLFFYGMIVGFAGAMLFNLNRKKNRKKR